MTDTARHPMRRLPLRFPLAALCAVALAGCTPDAPSTPPEPPTAAARGAQVYAMACARCHAADGRGSGELAARLGPIPPLDSPTVRAMGDDTLAALIREGRGAMPPHANRLDAAQIEAVITHVRALGAPR